MVKEIDNIQDKINWHWRNSMRPVRFFMLDARASLPFIILLVYARLWTIVLTLIITVIFYFFEKRGLTTPSAMRALRVWLIGYERPGIPSALRKRLRDFG